MSDGISILGKIKEEGNRKWVGGFRVVCNFK